jgi:hypothetical protein
MKKILRIILVAMVLLGPATAHAVLFDFDNAPLQSPLPIVLTVGGITAHFSATAQGYSIQRADVMGFTPAGFSGLCIYPSSVYLADLIVDFDQPLTDFSIMYSPDELGCDDSCTMRATAYMDGVYVGTNTTTANPPGTWPTGVLTFSAGQGFNRVVVHYDSPPPTCQDYGVIFMADNMDVTAAAPLAVGPAAESLIPGTVVSPNPFTTATSVRFSIARTGPVTVAIYSAGGTLVRTLVSGATFEPGARSIRWDGLDDGGHQVVSGVYLARVQADVRITSSRMLLLRG